MIQSHKWIYETYLNVRQVNGTEDGSVVCLDDDGNEVAIDLVTAQAKSDEDIAGRLLKQLRAVRNVKLAQSDWTQMGDITITDAKKTEWEAYRQALRDITETYDSLDTVVWPEKP